MPITVLFDGLGYANDFEADPVGALPAEWTVRAGAWEVIDLSGVGGQSKRVRSVDNSTAIVELTTVQAGESFVQITQRHTGASKFPRVAQRFNWGGGAYDGYFTGIGPTGSGCSISQLTNGSVNGFDADGDTIQNVDALVQVHVKDGRQEAHVRSTFISGPTDRSMEINGTDHDGQNAYTFGLVNGWGGLAVGGESNFDKFAIFLPASGAGTSRIITITGLPAGWTARIKNAGGTVVGSIVGPATTFNVHRYVDSTRDEIPVVGRDAGWPTLEIYDGSNALIETITAYRIRPGSTYQFTRPAVSFTPGRAWGGRDLVIARMKTYFDGTEFRWSGVAFTDRRNNAQFTEARVLSFNDLVVACSDRRGRLQRTGAKIQITDKAGWNGTPLTREWHDRKTGPVPRGSETIVELNSHLGILNGWTWFTAFRGAWEKAQFPNDFKTDIELLAWPWQRLTGPVLTHTMGDIVATCPSATAELVAPLAVGPCSDEPSATAPVVFVADETGRGGQGGAVAISSYADIGLPAPVNVTASRVAGGGSLNLGDHIGDRYYIFAAHVYEPSPGVFVVGDPLPFLPENGVQVQILADGDSIDAACNASAHPDYFATRFFICTQIVGGSPFAVQASHYIETNDPASGVTFTEVPSIDEMASGSSTAITPGGVAAINPYGALYRLALMPDGLTAPSVAAKLYSVGYARPVRLASTPIVGAIEYYDYVAYNQIGLADWRYTIPLSQVNSNSDIVGPPFSWVLGSGTRVPEGLPRPGGVVPPRYYGKVIDNLGQEWGGFMISARPGPAYFNGYMTDPETGLRVVIPLSLYGDQISAPGKADHATRFGSTVYYTINGYRTFSVFLRGFLLEAALHALGLAELTQAATTPATDGTLTLTTDGAADIEVVADGNAGLSNIDIDLAGSANQPLDVDLVGSEIVVTLGTDGAGNSDPIQNAASEVATRIANVAGVTSARVVGGSGTVDVQDVNFTGGAPEFTAAGNPWEGPFRCNANGLGEDVAGGTLGQGTVTEVVITHPVRQLAALADNGLLADVTLAGHDPLIGTANLSTTPPTFQDGTPRRDLASFAAAEIELDNLIPSGNISAFWIGTGITWEALLAEGGCSGPITHTFGLDGAYRVFIPNPYAVPVASVTAKGDIIRRSFSMGQTDQGFGNVLSWSYAPSYSHEDGSVTLTVSPAPLEDATSIDRHRARIPDKDPLQLPWRRHLVAARIVAALSLSESAYMPVHVPLDSGIHVVHRQPGETISVTHPEGLGATGFNDRAHRLLGLRVGVDLLKGGLVCLDLRRSAADLSPFLSEEIMATVPIGGSREHSCIDLGGGYVQPFDGFVFYIEWDDVPPSTHGQRVRVECAEDGAGTIKPEIYVEGDVPGVDLPAVAGVTEGANNMEAQSQTLIIPRPSSGGRVGYFLRGLLAGGATFDKVRLLGVKEGYRL